MACLLSRYNVPFLQSSFFRAPRCGSFKSRDWLGAKLQGPGCFCGALAGIVLWPLTEGPLWCGAHTLCSPQGMALV